ncbi:SDR family NAD(P)-dependent oxidoreductase [Oricola sp.]|uniref:SDR family NAD(P)-dependent oxidoreductase n=1 Tax=Oricola sp. TaxID=1979950 RepID=UPI0025CD6804|nr:SDR family NAD(P)-dependent oxidoreductase [Oricola sp.]MCI5077882.1 SDR family NAD(P)-dependent oxidoreductase [Oricola sp.]
MKTAVITGGAGGLGRALARALLAEGWHVAILDLPGDELEAVRDLGAEASAWPCDLTDENAVRAACAGIVASRPSVDLVIYNAGITQIGIFAEMEMSAHRTVFAVNYFGAVHVAAELLQAVRQSRGTHLAISSVAGFAPLHSRSAYSASKHALEGFFRTLASEERPFGVSVHIAAPSFVATNPGNAQERKGGIARPGSASDGIDYMEPDAAARIILDGVRRGRAMIPVGRVARLAWWINRFAPALYVRLMERNIADTPR